MVMTCFYIFAFVLVLSFVVLVHEGGHFLVARLCGVRVEEFSLGFGPEIFGRNDKKGTRWKICMVPLGGYVKMLGDTDAASAGSSVASLPEDQQRFAFISQKLWKRAAIIFAGPATNYVFAILILWFVLYFAGMMTMPAIISEVEEESAAAAAGLAVGDKITAINGRSVDDFTDVQRAVRLQEFGKELLIQFERDGRLMETSLVPKVMPDSDYPRIGVRSSVENMERRDDVGFIEALGVACSQTWWMTSDTLSYLGQVLFHQRPPKEMRGPIGIAQAAGDAFQGGFTVLMVFIANISVAVGFMNLLPIPLLDGGHLALYLLEAIRRKPLTEKVQNALMWMGFSILMGLVGYTFFLDIPRVIQRIME